ncbi:hypothetical protein S40293_10286 [Stachybotrys chartarum IBT 40293]|nr:hypothetical protein S40293_10286 [Stachybotrys chartarum IBT 40293]
MEFVAQHTSVPIPKIYEIYEYDQGAHLVMQEVPGGNIKLCYGGMTPEQIKTFGRELADCLLQLRALSPPSPGFIGSVRQESNIDHSLSGKPFGPFSSIADFHTYLRRGRPLAHLEGELDVVRTHSTPEKYSVKFSHAELNPNNIMVKDGHITAVIDWEFAGWYPEYWDYCKMYWCPRAPLWNNFYRAIEEEDTIVKYPVELAGEQAIWKRMHPWSYDDPPWQLGDDELALEERNISDINGSNSQE